MPATPNLSKRRGTPERWRARKAWFDWLASVELLDWCESNSVGTAPGRDGDDRTGHELEVEVERPVLDVVEIQTHGLAP